MAHEISGQKLREALEILFQRLVDQKLIKDASKKEQIIENLATELEAKHDNKIPQQLFRDPKKRLELYGRLVKDTLELTNGNKQEAKDILKKMLAPVLMKLEPDPAKRKKLEEELDKLLDKMMDKKFDATKEKEKSDEAANEEKINAFNTLEATFENLFGVSSNGQPVYLQMLQGDYTASTRDVTQQLGMTVASIGRDSQAVTEPTIHELAIERELDLGGVSEGVEQELERSGLLYKSPKPFNTEFKGGG